MNLTSAAAVFNQLDRELWLVTARDGSQRGGLIATLVNHASIVPELPRVVVGIARQHHTWGLIEASSAFALHLIGVEQIDWVWRFGLRSGRDVDKLEGCTVRPGATGSPILTDAIGWLDCRVEARLDTGDRTVYLAEVIAAELSRSTPPLTLKRALHLAPPDKLRELKEQLARDATVDAAAIRDWRERQTRL